MRLWLGPSKAGGTSLPVSSPLQDPPPPHTQSKETTHPPTHPYLWQG
jgi:hypothetical protein